MTRNHGQAAAGNLPGPGLFLFLLSLITAALAPACGEQNFSELRSGIETRGAYIEGVPFYEQKEFDCGPSALAGVLAFWGEYRRPGPDDCDHLPAAAQGNASRGHGALRRRDGLHCTVFVRNAGSAQIGRQEQSARYLPRRPGVRHLPAAALCHGNRFRRCPPGHHHA